MYGKHAEDFAKNLSPGQAGGYLNDEIIEIIHKSTEINSQKT